MKKFSHGDWTASGNWIAKGKLIVSAGADEVVRSWTPKGALQHELKAPKYSKVCGTLSSPVVAAYNGGDADLTLWDAASGKTLRTLEGHPTAKKKHGAGGNVASAAMSPDGTLVASGGFDDCVRLWNVKTGSAGKHVQLTGLVWSLAFSPDSAFVAAGVFPHVVVIIDVKTGKKVASAKASKKAVTSVAFTPDGQLVTGGGAGELRLWRFDGKTLQSRGMFGIPDGGGIEGVAVSPNGKLVAAASRGCWVRVWDLESGDEKKKLWREDLIVGLDVDFSPDGKQLLYAGPEALGLVKIS